MTNLTSSLLKQREEEQNANPTHRRLQSNLISNRSTMAAILNLTGQALWLRGPNGMVNPIPIAAPPVALVGVGNYQIANVPLQNQAPLAPAPNILIANLGATPLQLAGQGFGIAAFNLAPNGGAFVLGNTQYNMT